MKKNPAPREQRRTPNKTENEKQIDSNIEAGDDCIDGNCFDGPNENQRTFVAPCDDCDPWSLPSEASREGQLLVDLALGRFVSNQSHYENSISLNDHDGRKSLSVLRKEHGIQLEWFPVGDTRARMHRIIPKCLPNIQRAIKAVWGRDIAAAASKSKSKLAKASKKPSAPMKKGGRR